MSATESFWARWARVKREANAAVESARPAEHAEAVESAKAAERADATERAEAAEPAVAAVAGDSGLPSIDSITRGSDIRPFLQPGVPVELTRAALRAAWVVDPSIRDFIGIADSQWDFNDRIGRAHV